MAIHLNGSTPVGTIFLTRDNRQAVYLGKTDGRGKTNFRFRLLEEHNAMREFLLERSVKTTDSRLEIKLSDEIIRKSFILDLMGIKDSRGDWYVRSNGCCIQGFRPDNSNLKWDILEQTTETVSVSGSNFRQS